MNLDTEIHRFFITRGGETLNAYLLPGTHSKCTSTGVVGLHDLTEGPKS